MPLEFVNPPRRYIETANSLHWSEPVQNLLPWPSAPVVICTTHEGVTYWYTVRSGTWVRV